MCKYSVTTKSFLQFILPFLLSYLAQSGFGAVVDLLCKEPNELKRIAERRVLCSILAELKPDNKRLSSQANISHQGCHWQLCAMSILRHQCACSHSTNCWHKTVPLIRPWLIRPPYLILAKRTASSDILHDSVLFVGSNRRVLFEKYWGDYFHFAMKFRRLIKKRLEDTGLEQIARQPHITKKV